MRSEAAVCCELCTTKANNKNDLKGIGSRYKALIVMIGRARRVRPRKRVARAMSAPTPFIEKSATLQLRPLCGRLAS